MKASNLLLCSALVFECLKSERVTEKNNKSIKEKMKAASFFLCFALFFDWLTGENKSRGVSEKKGQEHKRKDPSFKRNLQLYFLAIFSMCEMVSMEKMES